MIIPDVNVLIYAIDVTSARHEVSRSWRDETGQMLRPDRLADERVAATSRLGRSDIMQQRPCGRTMKVGRNAHKPLRHFTH